MAKFGATSARTGNSGAIERIKARLDGVSEAKLNRAANRALISTRRKLEPLAKRVIRETYNVKLGDLSGKFQVRTDSDSGGEFIALSASTRGIPLLNFGGRWGGRKTAGATAQVIRGQSKIYQSAFIATIGGTRKLVARQLIRGGGGRRDPRNRLRTLLGPSPFQMVEGLGETNAKRITSEATVFLRSEIQRQLELARKGGR